MRSLWMRMMIMMMMMMMQSKVLCKVAEQTKGGEIGSFAFVASAFFCTAFVQLHR